MESGKAGIEFKTIDQIIGRTPLVKLQRQKTGSNTVLVKLEGNNPAGSVKDRPALSMIEEAEQRGEIEPGDTLIEATSGNTGIALAMVAAIRGYGMILIMPEDASGERRALMASYGARLVLTPADLSMEGARDKAMELEGRGEGRILNQFDNPDNPLAHYRTTGPEIWEDTGGAVTHFVSSMGTTGTIMGAGRYLHEKNPDVTVIGVQPDEGSHIPGIRKWSGNYLPQIYDKSKVDRLVYVSQDESEEMTRRLAREEGIFCGISSGGAVAATLRIARESEGSIFVTIICDRGERYLSTGVFPEG